MLASPAAGDGGGRRPRRVSLVLLAVGALVATGALLGCGSAGSTADRGSAAGASAAAYASAGASANATARPSPQQTPTARPTPKPSASKPGAGPASPAGSAGGGAARIVFVDVGQGDATIITSGSWAGLIDGGPAHEPDVMMVASPCPTSTKTMRAAPPPAEPAGDAGPAPGFEADGLGVGLAVGVCWGERDGEAFAPADADRE